MPSSTTSRAAAGNSIPKNAKLPRSDETGPAANGDENGATTTACPRSSTREYPFWVGSGIAKSNSFIWVVISADSRDSAICSLTLSPGQKESEGRNGGLITAPGLVISLGRTPPTPTCCRPGHDRERSVGKSGKSFVALNGLFDANERPTLRAGESLWEVISIETKNDSLQETHLPGDFSSGQITLTGSPQPGQAHNNIRGAEGVAAVVVSGVDGKGILSREVGR